MSIDFLKFYKKFHFSGEKKSSTERKNMANKINIAETFCKKMLIEFPNAIGEANIFRSRKPEFGNNWPDWCDLPMAVTYSILTDGNPNPTLIMEQIGADKIAKLTAAMIWTRYKTTFTFDEDLLSALQDQQFDGDIPGHVLERLPYPCVFIETSETSGFFAWLEWDVPLKMQELRVLTLDGGKITSIPVPIVGNFKDSMKALTESAKDRMKSNVVQQVILDNKRIDDLYYEQLEIKKYLNPLLYICSDKPDMPEYAEVKARRTYSSDGAAKRPAAIHVGTRIGSILRTAKKEVTEPEKTQENKSHSSPVPHIRRAHWHHFWTGSEEERILILKWLPPIPVNIDDEDPTPVIREVEEKR